jgi:type IV pilus assembly protein PilA
MDHQGAGKKGFTLIELLIVTVIIGVLAAIAIPKYSAVREKGFRAAMMSDLRNLAHFQEVYHNFNFSYASTLADAEADESEGVLLTITDATGTGWAATAVHQALGTEQCGIYHGTAAPAGGSPATVVSVVTCSF